MNINIGDIDVGIHRKATVYREGNLLILKGRKRKGNSDRNRGKINKIVPISAKPMDTS